jgi:hypothetical protein
VGLVINLVRESPTCLYFHVRQSGRCADYTQALPDPPTEKGNGRDGCRALLRTHSESNSMKLDLALHRDNNNADLLRLIAACAVIWGHAYALVPGATTTEPVGKLLGFDYSGSLAVEFFYSCNQ